MMKPKTIRIDEAVIVEGRDDVAVVERAVDGLIIATHGFGITKQTWALIERAYCEKGIIILTDPDFSGEEIRRKLTQRFPDAKQAYMPRAKAICGDDIGIENARPEDVIEALSKVKTECKAAVSDVTMQDLVRLGYSGTEEATSRRERLAERLGIGMGNCKAILRMINGYGISLEDVERATKWVDQATSQ